MNKLYVMSDIHGHFNRFIKMLRYIKFDETDSMLLLGNVIDFGPQSIALLQFISQTDNIRMCIGGHETLFIDAVIGKKLETFDVWCNQLGGRTTYDEYNSFSEKERHQVMNYLLESCPSFFTVERFFLSNAGIYLYSDEEIKDTSFEKKEFKKVFDEQIQKNSVIITDDSFYTKPGFKDRIIVFGSISVQQIRNNPKNYKMWHDPIHKDKICINTGINYPSLKLGCLCLNNMKEFYL